MAPGPVDAGARRMGNGFAVSALAGRRELMELGGLATDADRVFLLSTTHGAEAAGLAAFRAVVRGLPHDATRSARWTAPGDAPGRPASTPVSTTAGIARLRRGRRTPVLPGLRHPRCRRRALAGVPDAVPAGAAAPRRARAVVRDVRRAHRRRRRPDGRGGRRRPAVYAKAVERGSASRPARGPAGRARAAPARGPAPPLSPHTTPRRISRRSAAMWAEVNRASTSLRPARPISAARSGSASRAPIASAIASGSPGGTSRPVRPCST